MEITLLLMLIAGTWFWLDSIAKRDMAVEYGKKLSQRYQLQFLDETVSCGKLRLKRDEFGHVQLHRIYDFEVTAYGQERMPCQLQLLGKQLLNWHIPPYLHKQY